MKLQSCLRITGLAIVCLMIAPAAASSEKEEEKRQGFPPGFQPPGFPNFPGFPGVPGFPIASTPNPLVNVLGAIGEFSLALAAGLLLGRILGGLGLGNLFGLFGRDVSNSTDSPLHKLEEHIISDMLELMMDTDPDDCYRRWICDIATGEEDFSEVHPFLNFASDNEDLFIPKPFQKYSEQLISARRTGEKAENHQVCEDTFQCPFTGERMTQMMKEKLPKETNEGH